MNRTVALINGDISQSKKKMSAREVAKMFSPEAILKKAVGGKKAKKK